ncbi:39S ribosomal protein L52, mitochondrial-like [Teleopsis dalmanni]|uniref:39S ribosomal protein L52, mitochondrial-like n=1 Tax=Teleopsis dalmanni TaxID=139649 RepID=UPI0018CDE9BC|nr:39S ribosomal protein L52, mitochondrial-like [Teleopsis dalmanni]
MLKTTKSFRNITQIASGVLKRNISLTASCYYDQKWREDKGLPMNSNAFGPLTNLPDYTFLDGRPTPLGSNQKARLERQHQIAEKMVTQISELNYAKERHARLKAEKSAEKESIIKNKLKPKGHLLLKKD